ncbi:MAG: aldehyde dehydrogenase family protein [Planctomycetes bacterium]|nr:aldehyde dehydrogenase family protein [Planctomycetota bacterium]
MSSSERLPILKTFKLFINGAFPRTESGRTMIVNAADGAAIAHLCLASRKDLRNAVAAARTAQSGWQKRSAYNKGQVLYRMAEMLEGKSAEFLGAGCEPIEITEAIDRLVAFAGWADKYPQILGCANPVAGPFHNFTIPEATGVVGVIAPDELPLLGLISLIAPVLCAGNSVVALGSSAQPLPTALFAEVCATSDVPAGVVNLLTGQVYALIAHFASPRDVDAIHAGGCNTEDTRTLDMGAAENLKRVTVRDLVADQWYQRRDCHSPYWIESFVEMKTLWHPLAT